MKRCLFFIVLAVATLTTGRASAQSFFSREMAVGITGGYNFSSVSFTPKVKQGMQQGIVGGVMLRWITEKNLGIQAEVLYSQQGWKEKFPDNPEYKYSRTANFVEVPFLTHIYFGGQHVKAYVNMGPYVGYLLSESTESNLGTATPNTTNDQHDMDIKNTVEWGICGGPGLEFDTPLGTFTLEGRYAYSFNDIYGTRRTDVFSKASMSTLSARITYLIPIKKN
jgi:hypothetical protein